MNILPALQHWTNQTHPHLLHVYRHGLEYLTVNITKHHTINIRQKDTTLHIEILHHPPGTNRKHSIHLHTLDLNDPDSITQLDQIITTLETT